MMNLRYGWLICLSLALGACSSWRADEPRTFGEQMQNRADMNKEVGAKWQRGHDKVQRGQRMINDGNAMIREGEREMREAEEQARAVRQSPVPLPSSSGGMPATTTPPQAAPMQ